MKTSSISSAKNNLSALLDRVRAGETIIITDRGIPVARLEPVRATGTPGNSALKSLIRRGLVIPPSRRPSTEVLELPLPVPTQPVSASQLIVEERESEP